MKHTIISTKDKKNSIVLDVPDDYSPQSLPYFKQWVDALKSGKIKQTRSTLCRKDGKCNRYCCLGVLSKIQGRLSKNIYGSFHDNGQIDVLSSNNPSYQVLKTAGDIPYNVKLQTSYNNTSCTVNTLASLNDRGFTFKDIAKVIEILWKE